MARPKQNLDQQLTDTELSLMNILWDIQPATAREVMDTLLERQKKEYAYTTVSTLLRILEKKSFVSSQKEGRGHIYSACIPKASYQTKALGKVVSKVFGGKPQNLIRNLLGHEDLSPEDIKDIEALLKSRQS